MFGQEGKIRSRTLKLKEHCVIHLSIKKCFQKPTSLLAYNNLAKLSSECRPQTKQYTDVLATLEPAGVVGGVASAIGARCCPGTPPPPPPPPPPLGETAFGVGDGMMYLRCSSGTRSASIVSHWTVRLLTQTLQASTRPGPWSLLPFRQGKCIACEFMCSALVDSHSIDWAGKLFLQM